MLVHVFDGCTQVSVSFLGPQFSVGSLGTRLDLCTMHTGVSTKKPRVIVMEEASCGSDETKAIQLIGLGMIIEAEKAYL